MLLHYAVNLIAAIEKHLGSSEAGGMLKPRVLSANVGALPRGSKVVPFWGYLIGF